MAAGVVINLLNLPFSLTALQHFSLLCVIAGRHRNLFDILRLIDRAGGPVNAKEILGSRGTSQQSAELPMNGLERRLTPRIEWLADIHFEPNNGGIVLDLSEGGLSFHAIDPIQTDSTIHFSVSLHDQRIQATGELAWINRTKTTGGLRFTGLSAEARQQVHDWTKQAAPALSFDDASSRPVPTLRAFPEDTGVQPESTTAPLEIASLGRKGLTSWSGFSAGLGVGVLVSALVGAAFSFHTYRRQFGASIIQFGERVAAKPQAQPQMASPVVQPELPAALAVSTPGAPISIAQHSESLIPQPSRNAPAPQPLPTAPQAKSEPLVPDTAWLIAVGSSRPKAPTANGSTLTSETPPSLSLPTIVVASKSYLVPSKLGPAPPLAPASEPNVHSVVSGKEDAGSPSEMYLEVGKFKDQPPASEVKDKLATLGFPASVTQKGRFWGNSYYVLVGPYDNDREAKAARKNLTSRGFKPRAFERGSRAFAFSYVLTLDGARIPVGDYSIRWESYSSLVVVEFVQNNDIVATVDGKWAKRDTPYDHGAYAFTSNGDGSRNLVWIQFAGMRQTLLF